MNKFRTLIVRFDSIINLQSFYDLEFKNLQKFNDRNIRLNYKKTNFNHGINLTFEWYFKNKAYYKSFSKRDILRRLGKI